MCPCALTDTCLYPLRLQTALLACVPCDTRRHTVQRRLGTRSPKVPFRSIALWVAEFSISFPLSLSLHLPSSGPGGLQRIPCRDPGSEETANLKALALFCLLETEAGLEDEAMPTVLGKIPVRKGGIWL